MKRQHAENIINSSWICNVIFVIFYFALWCHVRESLKFYVGKFEVVFRSTSEKSALLNFWTLINRLDSDNVYTNTQCYHFFDNIGILNWWPRNFLEGIATPVSSPSECHGSYWQILPGYSISLSPKPLGESLKLRDTTGLPVYFSSKLPAQN